MRTLLLASLLLLVSPATAQIGTLLPVDEAAADPSFVLFRARLLEAAQARDTSFVLSHLHPEVFLSFGGASGVDDFKEYWLSNSPDAPDFWTEIVQILPFGSTYTSEPSPLDSVRARASVPYWYGAWPDSLAEDVFDLATIVGENVRVRAAPNLEAEVLATLTYDIIVLPFDPDNVYPTLYDPNIQGEWKRIILEDKREGYVAERYLGSPIDYRMGFDKVDGRWRIVFFVAGD